MDTQLGMLEYLLSRGAEMKALKESATVIGTWVGNMHIVDYLVSCQSVKETLIHIAKTEDIKWAAQYGHLDVLKYLVSVGGDIHADDDYAIWAAWCMDHKPIVRYCVSLGAPTTYVSVDYDLNYESDSEYKPYTNEYNYNETTVTTR